MTGKRASLSFQRASEAGGRTDLWWMSADGSNASMMLRDASDPRWPPDGTQIAFVRASNVWVMNADGADEPIRITNLDPSHAGDLVWSPDSRQIAFSHADTVWVVAAEGADIYDTGLPRGTSPTSWGGAPPEPNG